MRGDGVGVGPFTKQVVWKGNDPHGGRRPPCGSLPFNYLLCKRTHPYPVTLLPIGLGYSRAKPSPVWTPQLFWNLVIIHLLAHEDGTECSETSAYKIQTPGNYAEENIQHLKICSSVIYLLMPVSPVSTYEPVLRSKSPSGANSISATQGFSDLLQHLQVQ